MIRCKLLYAALLVVMVLFFILYRGTLSLTLLIFTLLLPVYLWFSLRKLRKSVDCALTHTSMPEKGEPFHWVLQIRNRSWFSSAFARLNLEYSSSLSDHVQPLTLLVPVMMHNTQRVRMTFHAMTCGVMKMHVTSLELYDPLRIFRRVLPVSVEDTVIILPLQSITFTEKWQPHPSADADTAEYSKEKPGDDPSEIFDLHGYREGDPISRIHWKLSSKHEDLMVKEYSLPLSSGYLLLPDYRITDDPPNAAIRLDAMLSAFRAVAAQLHESMISFQAAYVHADDGTEISRTLSEPSETTAWLHRLVHYRPFPKDSETAFGRLVLSMMAEGRTNDRLLLFTPRLTKSLAQILMSLPSPSRLTVFAVSMDEEDAEIIGGATYPFSCVPVVPEPLPETEPLPPTDFDFDDFADGVSDDDFGKQPGGGAAV